LTEIPPNPDRPERRMQTSEQPIRVIIAGGGYAGLATLIALRQHCPNAEILLTDPSSCHLRRTHLHESFRRGAGNLRVAFSEICGRFRCRHIQAALEFSPEKLGRWQQKREIEIGKERFPFDYLVIATGATSILPKNLERVYSVEDLALKDAHGLLQDFVRRTRASERVITVVGAGPTGIQFLFELNEVLREWKRETGLSCHLRLVNSEAAVLDQFPASFDRYVGLRMKHAGIEYVKNAFLVEQIGNEMLLEDRATNRKFCLASPFTLAFIGQKANPEKIYANAFGQAIVAGKVLENIFTAGDCSVFSGRGANTMSAQVAVRKGKKVARNIQLHSGSLNALERYRFHELGYFVSLGPFDGIGWLGLKANVMAALPAFCVKQAVEVQFDLLLSGLDTYIV
jgi:NADH:ubiquinone reductase (H+-translocating)